MAEPPKDPSTSKGSSFAASVAESSSTYHRLPIYPGGAKYDTELERLCRTAAVVGARQARSGDPPVTYTSLLIAFLFGGDQVSVWFRSYASQRTDAICNSEGASLELQGDYLTQADSGWLPDVQQMYTTSVRNVMQSAAEICRSVRTRDPSTLAPRHVMAAYAYRNPIDHREQVRGWGFDEKDWQDRFFEFVLKAFPDEQWAYVVGRVTDSPTAPPEPKPSVASEPTRATRAPAGDLYLVDQISSVTSDNPYSPARDLLGIGNEIGAFARILAAKSIAPPLAIGIFGDWGSGKSFFMRSIYEKVDYLASTAKTRSQSDTDARERGEGDSARQVAEERLPESPFYSEIVQIRFNAWHYIESNLWASLVEYIFAELDRWLLDKTQNTPSKADVVFNRLSTAQQLKLDALEDVVARRAERQSAANRADNARRDYEKARARRVEISGKIYIRALLDTFLKPDSTDAEATKNAEVLRDQVDGIVKAFGVNEAADSADEAVKLVEEARSEVGRARLIARAGIAKLGTATWIVSTVIVLVGFPVLLVALQDIAVRVTKLEAINKIHESVLALAGLAASVVACGGTLLQRAKVAVNKIDRFDKALAERVSQEERKLEQSPIASARIDAENAFKKRQQELEAAERALADADSRLAAARQDFESSTARRRLNAFIRAKVADGDYAKHLGIIAAIRRDFNQLATLMAASESGRKPVKGQRLSAEAMESDRLAKETQSRVMRFVEWLGRERDVRLTTGELRSVLMLVEPDELNSFLETEIDVQLDVPIGVTFQRTDDSRPEPTGRPTFCSDVLYEHVEGGEDAVKTVVAELPKTTSDLPKFSRIILYIDDLDRCPTKTVVSVLQAVHLLLGFPLFTVVVAVDARWVSRALNKEYPDLLTETGVFSGNRVPASGAATSHNYLEKIFQIPYWVRPMEPTDAQNYVHKLIERDIKHPPGQKSEPLPAINRVSALDEAPPPSTAMGADFAKTGTGPPPDITPARSSAEESDDGHESIAEEHQRQAIRLELTDWESLALQQFAPLVANTPRRLIRFVNVYRLIKASLPADKLDTFVGSKGESVEYQAMIAQLAIVTAACDSSNHYFSVLEDITSELDTRLASNKEFSGSADSAKVIEILSLSELDARLASNKEFSGSADSAKVTEILARARQWAPSMKLEHLLATAPLARRFSFTAGLH